MSPDRLGRIDELYHAALERQPGERDVFLATACQDDADLREEVESRLAQNPLRRQALAPGAQLGPYRVIGVVGTGGQGEVYRASDSRLRRDVAIKVLPEHLANDPHARARFEHEARAIAALNHPHICQIYDIGPDYLVMEFVDGAPLKGPLPLKKAVEYADQILDALDAAHRKGITHRDLKPGNILVTKQGIKLLDFGLAKQKGPLKETDGTVTMALTDQGQIVGTPQYMSPEQLHGKEADARSDLFSFGCVLYEMLTGRRAFDGQSAASVIAAILEREPAPLTEAPPLSRIVQRSLAKDPDQRFQTARDLKAALAWALDQPSPVRPRRPWWITAAAALVVGALGGWAVSHFRQSTSDERVLRLQIDPPEGGRFGGTGSIALSPDGKTAAYVASVNGKLGLWVRPLDRSTARLVAGTEGAAFPFWSPDDKSIAFFAGSKLQRVDLEGGVPVNICDALAGLGGAWINDGHILFGDSSLGLFQVSASGGAPSRLTTLEASEGSHRWPQMLPGGRFLYYVEGNQPESSGVYAASLAKPTERVRLLTTDTNAVYAAGANGKSYLLWRRGGTLVAQEFDAERLKLAGEPHPIPGTPVAAGFMNVTVSDTAVLLHGAPDALNQLTWFDRAGKPLGVVGEPGYNVLSRISPDGRRLVSVRFRAGAADLWLLEVDRGVFSRFTLGGGFHFYPVWSPNGGTIVFASGSPFNLFRKDANGAGSEQRLTQAPNTQVPTDWSGDGQSILYTEVAPGKPRDIWVLPVTPEGIPAEGAKPRPYARTSADETGGRFSPEPSPHWVAYQSDESGRPEVYIRAFPQPRGGFQISASGGRFPEWSAGGRELFYVSPANRLMAVSLKLGSESVEPSAPRELFPLPAVELFDYRPYEATPDGQRFLVAVPQPSTQPLTVIVNWPALLKKSSAAE